MRERSTIITIQAPAGTELEKALPYLERSGVVEFRSPSVAYIDAGYEARTKRLRKKLLLLRATIETLLNVHVRIGAGSSKSVSLVAARQSSPGGITIVPKDEEAEFLEQVVIDLLPGIGRRTATYLRNRGVDTIGKFGRLPQRVTVRLFGVSGITLNEFSRGSDPRQVIPHMGKHDRQLAQQPPFSIFKNSRHSTVAGPMGLSAG